MMDTVILEKGKKMADRLISADALLREAMKDGAYGYVDAEQIENAPTVDAVEVVRCKDCFWFIPYTHTNRPIGACDCDITIRSAYNEVPILEVPLDGYCSRGKRREDA